MKHKTEDKNYLLELELKYGGYGKSLIQSFEDIIEKRDIGTWNRDDEWNELFTDWKNWDRKQKQEYLYYITHLEDNHMIGYTFGFLLFMALIIGFFIGSSL